MLSGWPRGSTRPTMYGRPRFAKRSIRDGLKVKIAAMYPDFESGTCLLSLMEYARQDLISCPCS